MGSVNSIIAVVGKSGSGKTTGAEFASRALGIENIVSYTTRPKREGERHGKEHYFVSEEEMPPREEMVAYTFFGGYHYWTTKKQFNEDCLYVIDEEGLRMLMDSEYNVLPLYVERKEISVEEERKARDKDRVELPSDIYRAIVVNDGTLEKFLYGFTVAVGVLLTDSLNDSQFVI